MSTLREAKKTRTRAAIAGAATRLFAERGYTTVTMADVAAAAEVGERTVFRYFASKEELLFGEDEAFRAALADAFAHRPADEAPFDALLGATQEVAAGLAGRRAELAERLTVIRGTAPLEARERAKHAGFEAVITDALRARGVKMAQARLLARIGVACYDEGVERWLTDEDAARPGLPDRIADAAGELRRSL